MLAVGSSCIRCLWRGPNGVHVVISDAHDGLRSALSQVFAGATWQRCKVHSLRNVASAVPKLHASAVLAVVRWIFLQPTREHRRYAVNHTLDVLEPRCPPWRPSSASLSTMCSPYVKVPVDHWR